MELLVQVDSIRIQVWKKEKKTQDTVSRWFFFLYFYLVLWYITTPRKMRKIIVKNVKFSPVQGKRRKKTFAVAFNEDVDNVGRKKNVRAYVAWFG